MIQNIDLLAWKKRLRPGREVSSGAGETTQVFAPLLGLVVALALVMLGVLTASGRSADRMALARQELQIVHLLDLEREKLRFSLSHWPTRLTGSSFLVQPDGRIIRAMHDGVARAAPEQAKLGASLTAFITGQSAQLQGPAALIGQTSMDQPRADYVSTPLGPYLLGMTAFDPRKQQAVLVARPLGKDFVAQLANRLQLSGVRLHTDQAAKIFGARTWIYNQDGQRILAIDWNFHYGETFLRFLPFLGLTLTLSAAFAVLFSRRIGRVIRNLVAGRDLARNQAFRDPLTGLANRALFGDRLKKALGGLDRHNGGIAVLYIDLDNFKDINDTLGHQAGDELICEIGERLSEACRAEDTVARMGGDEFAILQTLSGSSAASSRLARRLLADAARPVQVSGHCMHISASIGVAQIDAPGVSAQDAMRQADIALYRAKDSGRNGYRFFEAEMDESLRRRKSIEADLREAIEHKQLNVAYQLQMSADGQRIHGVEALLRWKHSEKGAISPAEFIPVAEESGLIARLGDYVMEQALADARHWPLLTIAVNVSASELRQIDYVQKLTARAERFGIEPGRIELEITETALLRKTDAVAKIIRELKENGFKIALDDFGTEYSSLSYLRQHLVDRLKIDRSFVAAIGVRHDATAVINAIIQIGLALGLSVTAEGVETEEQKNTLRQAGCGSLQGYLLARPMSARAINMVVERVDRGLAHAS